jgi:purine-binding chemotaxis protein CheW
MASRRSEQLLSFRVNDERLAIPASAIREVIRRPATVRVPHAPKSLVGLGNLRGTVLSIVSLASLIDRPAGDGKRVIVLDEGQGIGLLVDEVSALIDKDQTQGADRVARLLDIGALLERGFKPTAARKASRAAMAEVRQQVTAAADQIVLLAFAIGDQEFALPLEQIEEVIRLPDGIALMPHADDAVVGTAAHRGTLLPMLSLRHLLSLPGTSAASASRVVIARLGGNRVGLVVDAVNAIVRITEEMVDTIPVVLTRGSGEARIQAICRLDGGRRLISLLAASHLLRDDLVARLADELGEQDEVVDDQAANAGESEQFLIFRIGDEDFGLPVAAVNEVVRIPDALSSLPRAPKFVEGIMNLRGQAVPVIDQRRRFDAPAEAGHRRRVIIVSLGDLQAGFVVDAVSDVMRIAKADLSAAPDLGDGAVRVFDRVANLESEQRMILLVEPRELLDRAERDLIAAMALGEASPPS